MKVQVYDRTCNGLEPLILALEVGEDNVVGGDAPVGSGALLVLEEDAGDDGVAHHGLLAGGLVDVGHVELTLL